MAGGEGVGWGGDSPGPDINSFTQKGIKVPAMTTVCIPTLNYQHYEKVCPPQPPDMKTSLKGTKDREVNTTNDKISFS